MRRSSIFAGVFATLILFLPPAEVFAAGQGSIDGRIVDAATGEPVGSAEVTLAGSGMEGNSRVISGPSGRFRFPILDPGNYELTAEATGYFPEKYNLVLKPRQPLSLTVELASRRTAVQHAEVHATYADIDPGQTGTSRVLTRRNLDELPSPEMRSVMAMAEVMAPGAVLSHDNFVHVRGNELSLHEFINGVSFLDNANQQFTPGLSPEIFESVNIITGGFPAEFGNRFGGILDITTRSGRTMRGHGAASVGVGTVLNHDASVEYGGSAGRLGYFFYLGGSESGRFLNPPEPRELHDLGYGGRGAAQIDYQTDRNMWKLLILGGGTNFQQPNNLEQAGHGRDAHRRLRSQSAILSWQHIFSPRLLLGTSAYQREVSDRLVPTSDPETSYGRGSRSTLTTGLKSDLMYARAGHTFKAGVDTALFRLRESFEFDPRDDHDHLAGPAGEPAAAAASSFFRLPSPPHPAHTAGGLEAFAFRGRDLGGQVSFYAQDHFSLARHLTLDAGVRSDQINLVGSYHQVSPRVGVAYYIPRTRSVVHFTYNRFFTPPPLEYAVLASYLGNAGADAEERVGNVRPFRQNYYEVGWSQQLHPKVFLEIDAYAHRGRNSFETSEIADTRLFLPTNFDASKVHGIEVSLRLRQLERLGLSGRIQYAAAQVKFFGPVSGGYPGELLAPGERILPAFDQKHTATADIIHRSHWRDFWTGFVFRYGSGTPREEEIDLNGEEVKIFPRLPQHFTADFSTGLALWKRESSRLAVEFNVSNFSESIYRISKESQTTPIQFAPRRVVSGRLTWHF